MALGLRAEGLGLAFQKGLHISLEESISGGYFARRPPLRVRLIGIQRLRV